MYNIGCCMLRQAVGERRIAVAAVPEYAVTEHSSPVAERVEARDT